MNRLQAAVSEVMNGLNVLSGGKERESDVVGVFRSTHRTLQQQFVKVVIIPVLQQLAKDYEQGFFDGRNQEAAALAAKMLAAVTEDDLYLPMR